MKVLINGLQISNIINSLKKYKISQKYILFIGNIEPPKNLVRLIKAYYYLVYTNNIPQQLIIAWEKGWKYKEVFNTVRLLELENRVIFTGYVPESDLPALYSMADIFVYSSIYEGSGISPLEAMSCKTPVLASNKGALSETTGGNCIMVNPYSINDIVNGLFKLLTEERLRIYCICKGEKWVEQFTWETH